MWKRLKHPIVLPLLGVIATTPFRPISSWMPSVDLSIYIMANPGVSAHPVMFIPHSLRLPGIRYC